MKVKLSFLCDCGFQMLTYFCTVKASFLYFSVKDNVQM